MSISGASSSSTPTQLEINRDHIESSRCEAASPVVLRIGHGAILLKGKCSKLTFSFVLFLKFDLRDEKPIPIQQPCP